MIFALIGPLCSGKETLANYLKEKFNFRTYNIQEEFYSTLPTTTSSLSPEERFKLFYSKDHEKDVSGIVKKAFESSFNSYKESLVIYPITNRDHVEIIKSRKFVFMISITAPLLKRYQQFCEYHFELPLEKFVELDDSINCGLGNYAAEIEAAMAYSDHMIQNQGTKEEYLSLLTKIDFCNGEALRPEWDTYFMQVAELSSRRSNCIKRAVGSVLVKGMRILSTGYNGTPFGIENCNKGGCEQCVTTGEDDKDMDKCICLHAEQNTVFAVGRIKSENATLYTTTFPCLLCAKAIIQAGVCKVVYFRECYENKFALLLFELAAVTVKKHSPFVLSSHLTLS